MTKNKSFLILLTISVFTISCEMMAPLDDKLLMSPDNKPAQPETVVNVLTPWGAPQELTALSGMADRIELEWNPVLGADYYLISYTQDPFADFNTPLDELKQEADLSRKVSWRLSGTEANALNPGSVYYFRIRAVNSAGDVSDFSSVVSGGLMDIPRIAEPILEPGKVTLHWTLPNLSVDGVSYNPVFTVFRKRGNESYAIVSSPENISVNGPTWSLIQKGIDPKTAYTYKILVEVEGSDQSLESTAFEVVTLDQSYPDPVINLRASQGNFAELITVNWTAPTELAGYEGIPVVYTLSRQSGDSASEVLTEKTAGLTSWSDTTGVANRDYIYSLTPFYAHDQDGITVYSSPGETMATTGYRLWEPVGLTVRADKGAALVTWIYPSEKALDVSFRLYRVEDLIDGAEEMLADGLAEPFFRDETLSPLTSYHYRVAAVNKDGEEELSAWKWTNESFRFTPGMDDTIRNLTVSEGLADTITLNWKGMENIKYNIYRNDSGYGYSAADLLVSDLVVDGEGNVSFSEEGLAAGTVLYYRVESDMDGQKNMSDSLRGFTLALPGGLRASQGLYTDRIILNWNETEEASSYRLLYRKAGSADDFIAASPFTPEDMENPSLEFTPPGNGEASLRGILWELTLKALKESDGQPTVETAAASSVTGCTLGPALIGLQASRAEYKDKVVLRWNDVRGAEFYDIYRNTEDNPLTAQRILQGIRGNTAEDMDTAYLIGGRESYYFIRPLKSGVTSNILSTAQSAYALSPPAGCRASQGSSATGITLSWDEAPGSVSYNVYRQTGSSWLKVGSNIRSHSWNYPLSDQDLNLGNVSSSFMVRSVGTGGLESLEPAEVTIGYALSRPIAVSASKGDTSLLQNGKYYTRVFWPAVVGAESYRIQRLDDRSGDWHDAGTVEAGSGDVVEFRDPDALILRNYEQKYRVLTRRDNVTTEWSDETSGYRQVSPEEFLNIVNFTINSALDKHFMVTIFNSGGANGIEGRYENYKDSDKYFNFSNYRDYFVKINGSFKATGCYWASGGEYDGIYKSGNSEFLTISSTIRDSAGSPLYSGTVKFISIDVYDGLTSSPTWKNGTFEVRYNGQIENFDKNSTVRFFF